MSLCKNFYIEFMNLSCNHFFKITTVNQNFDRIFITHVYLQSRFIKFEFEITAIENFYTNKVIIKKLLNNF